VKNFKCKKRRVNFKRNARNFVAECMLPPSPTSTLTSPWLFAATCIAFPAFVIPTCRRSHIPFPSRRYKRRRQGLFNLYYDLWGNNGILSQDRINRACKREKSIAYAEHFAFSHISIFPVKWTIKLSQW